MGAGKLIPYKWDQSSLAAGNVRIIPFSADPAYPEFRSWFLPFLRMFDSQEIFFSADMPSLLSQ
jgi:hypothetical protein